MKNAILFYYNFTNIKIAKDNNLYKIYAGNKYYCLYNTNRDIYQLYEIYNIQITIPNKFNKIVLNKYNNIVTTIENNNYVLVEIQERKENIDIGSLLVEDSYYVNTYILYNHLRRDNWLKMWELKNDDYEYKLYHIVNKYPTIVETTNFFLGMAENAITYIYDTIAHENVNDKDILVICHDRIANITGIEEFYNPLNIVLDHKARDVSEYLKQLFIDNIYSEEVISNIIKKIGFSKYGYQMLFGRMLYPTFYFDICDNIISSELEEKKIYSFVNRIDEYVNYLKIIYQNIVKIYEIPRVDWI